MKNQSNLPFALICLMALLFSCAETKKQPIIADYQPLIEKYRKILPEEMKQFHISGLSIAIVDGDSVVWCEGFGYYNDKERKPVNGHTPFNIGSICKTFTAIAAIQLQERNKLKLDDPFRKYVPEFHMKSRFGSADDITVRQLLTHHAGIPDFIKDKMMEKPPYFTTVLNYVNDDYATFAPNTNYSYSNAGISLVGNLIENVSRQSYYDYLQKNILTPLGMTESGFVNSPLPESVLLGYTGSGKEMTELQVVDAPAGCIYSTAYDMTRYIKAMLHQGSYNHTRILDTSSFNEMTRIQNSDVFLDLGNPTGLAWTIYYNDAGKCIEHAGGTINHRAELCIAPEAGIGIIMMSNSANGGQCMFRENYEMFSEILKLKGMQPKAHKKPVANIVHLEHNFVYDEKISPSPVPQPVKELEKYTGTYGTFPMIFTIELREGKLWTNIWGNNWYLLPVENREFVSSGDTSFQQSDKKTRYYFEEVNNTYVFIQATETGKQQVFGEKIKIIRPGSVWTRRFGNYLSDGENKNYQMFSDFSLGYENDILVLKGKLHVEFGPPEFVIPLQIIDDNLAVIPGYDRFCGSAVQFVKGGDGREVMKFMGFTCTRK